MVKNGLGYSIRFKLGQMLHGQMSMVQMSPRQLTFHTDGLTIQPSNVGWVLASKSWDMASLWQTVHGLVLMGDKKYNDILYLLFGQLFNHLIGMPK